MGEKLDGMAAATRDTKYEWQRFMGCVSGFFFAIASDGVARKWAPVFTLLKKSRSDAIMGGAGLLGRWPDKRRAAIAEEAKDYGHTWEVAFAHNEDWAAAAGLTPLPNERIVG